MSSVYQNPSIEAGEVDYEKVTGDFVDHIDDDLFSTDKLELAVKIVEAEYLHENGLETGDKHEGTFFSEAGTEKFGKILQGAKQEIEEETYNIAKAYLVKESENTEKVAKGLGLKPRKDREEFGGDPTEWFQDEFDDSYDPVNHKGVNPEYFEEEDLTEAIL